MRELAVVGFVLLAACDQSQPRSASAEETLLERFEAKYPGRIAAISEKDIDAASGTTSCASDAEMEAWAKQSMLKFLNPRMNPHIDAIEIETVALKSGNAKLVATDYSFSPGDPGIRSKGTSWDLIRQSDCRAMNVALDTE